MSEDITPEVVTEAPEGQVEVTEAQGVEDTADAQVGTDAGLQSQEAELEAQAEADMFAEIAKNMGFEDPTSNEARQAIAKSYKELQSEYTRKSQAYKQTQQDLEAIESVLNGLVEPETTSYERPYQDPMYAEMRMMKSELDVKSVAERHEDFAELQPIMSEILAEVPQKSIFEGKQGIELLYKMAKAERVESLEKELAQAKAEGKKELSLKEVEKVRATVADGTKAKSQSQKIFTASEIARMDDATYMANRDAILRQQKEGLIL